MKAQLEFVDLDKNQIKELDLNVFSKFIRVLCLAGNQLTTIDLRPLAECPALSYLYLNDNLLEDVDLTPIARGRMSEPLGSI